MRPLGTERVVGMVVKTGFHDEVGAAPFVVVKDTHGVEHYARLGTGSATLAIGKTVTLARLSNGLGQVIQGRGAEFSR